MWGCDAKTVFGTACGQATADVYPAMSCLAAPLPTRMLTSSGIVVMRTFPDVLIVSPGRYHARNRGCDAGVRHCGDAAFRRSGEAVIRLCSPRGPRPPASSAQQQPQLHRPSASMQRIVTAHLRPTSLYFGGRLLPFRASLTDLVRMIESAIAVPSRRNCWSISGLTADRQSIPGSNPCPR